MKRDPRDYLEDMIIHARHAQEFVGEMNETEFLTDLRTRLAVLHCLQIIGEAARAMPAEVREKYANVPWREIIGMRNIVVHDYLGVEPLTAYDTVRRFVPPLIEALTTIIADLGGLDDGTAL